IAKPFSGSTAPSFGTRSRTWPYDASTSKSLPRYFSIVRALAGDSTMTTFLAMCVRCAFPGVRVKDRDEPPGGSVPRRRTRVRGAARRWVGGSVNPARTVGEDEILHLRVGLLVARLAEQHHHYDPFDLLDVDFVRVERQQPVDRKLPLRRRQDSDLLQMQQIASRGCVQPVKLDRVVDADRGGARGVAPGRFGRIQAVEPVERALDLAVAEAGLLELELELATVRLRRPVALGEGLEQIHQHVENAFLHRLLV